MDMYKYAEEMDTDYYDMRTGNTYLVQDYNRRKKEDPDAKMYVRLADGGFGIVRRCES